MTESVDGAIREDMARPQTEEEIKAVLNAQTGRLNWTELVRYFARGMVVKVATNQDLVSVASRFVDDDKNQVKALLNDGTLAMAGDDDARRWHQNNTEFWAVVVAPWVLVQECQQGA